MLIAYAVHIGSRPHPTTVHRRGQHDSGSGRRSETEASSIAAPDRQSSGYWAPRRCIDAAGVLRTAQAKVTINGIAAAVGDRPVKLLGARRIACLMARAAVVAHAVGALSATCHRRLACLTPAAGNRNRATPTPPTACRRDS